jgi:hypothetical protein
VNLKTKKMKKLLFITIYSVLTSFGAAASDTWVVNSDGDTIWYEFDKEEKTASVTYEGRTSSQSRKNYSGSIVIPSKVTYNGIRYQVTKIGINAFYECEDLTSVTIPSSVTEIVRGAFSQCKNLTTVKLSNGLANIGEGAFSGCGKLVDITIPNSVVKIESGAFKG